MCEPDGNAVVGFLMMEGLVGGGVAMMTLEVGFFGFGGGVGVHWIFGSWISGGVLWWCLGFWDWVEARLWLCSVTCLT